MNIVLKQDVKGLGFSGDIVRVAIGYARNFLIPQGIGVLATLQEIDRSKQIRAERIAKHDEIIKHADTIAKKLEAVTLEFKRKASRGTKLFGGIGESDIAEALLQQGKVEIDKSQIHLTDGHIKTTGEHTVDIHLYEGKHVQVKINVTAEE